jgi:hypothetical protein
VRRAARRAKQVHFRRHRVVVEPPLDESGAIEAEIDESEAEKIEVHVHVHRGERKSRSNSPQRPVLTGVLFDWQWYKQQLSKRVPQPARPRWSLVTRCEACNSPLSPTARFCTRCAAPRSRRRFIPPLVAMAALAGVAGLFALGAHLLGPSVPEHKAPEPVGQWTDSDVVIVEVPATPSPFAPTTPAPAASAPTPFNYGGVNDANAWGP